MIDQQNQIQQMQKVIVKLENNNDQLVRMLADSTNSKQRNRNRSTLIEVLTFNDV